MPTYEYRCSTCDVAFEQRRSMSEPETQVRCPIGHATVRRVFSVFAAPTGGAAAPASGGGCCGGACGCG